MELRTCRYCLETKPFDEQHFRRKFWKCRDCEREEARERSFFCIRGITYAQRDAILHSQGHKCACCGTTDHNSKKGWHTDHDHKTGKIRGVLCANCNIALGQVDDSIEHLQHLISYLEYHHG